MEARREVTLPFPVTGAHVAAGVTVAYIQQQPGTVVVAPNGMVMASAPAR